MNKSTNDFNFVLFFYLFLFHVFLLHEFQTFQSSSVIQVAFWKVFSIIFQL